MTLLCMTFYESGSLKSKMFFDKTAAYIRQFRMSVTEFRVLEKRKYSRWNTAAVLSGKRDISISGLKATVVLNFEFPFSTDGFHNSAVEFFNPGNARIAVGIIALC
jgi:hypothetical protein